MRVGIGEPPKPRPEAGGFEGLPADMVGKRLPTSTVFLTHWDISPNVDRRNFPYRSMHTIIGPLVLLVILCTYPLFRMFAISWIKWKHGSFLEGACEPLTQQANFFLHNGSGVPSRSTVRRTQLQVQCYARSESTFPLSPVLRQSSRHTKYGVQLSRYWPCTLKTPEHTSTGGKC